MAAQRRCRECLRLREVYSIRGVHSIDQPEPAVAAPTRWWSIAAQFVSFARGKICKISSDVCEATAHCSKLEGIVREGGPNQVARRVQTAPLA